LEYDVQKGNSMTMHTKRSWFAPYGWIHRPVSIMGWIITLAALAFCVHIFIAVDRHSHSVSDTLYGIFPFVVPCCILWNRVASKTCPAWRRGR